MEENIPKDNLCKSCKREMPMDANFCPYCGARISTDISLSRQVTIYALSLALPPIGFWYGYKYLKEKNDVSQKIGITAIFLTLVSLAITFWTLYGMYAALYQTIGEINSLGL